jgi:hypothetical protein
MSDDRPDVVPYRLLDLDDVDGTPADGTLLRYDAASSAWAPVVDMAGGSAHGPLVTQYRLVTDTGLAAANTGGFLPSNPVNRYSYHQGSGYDEILTAAEWGEWVASPTRRFKFTTAGVYSVNCSFYVDGDDVMAASSTLWLNGLRAGTSVVGPLNGLSTLGDIETVSDRFYVSQSAIDQDAAPFIAPWYQYRRYTGAVALAGLGFTMTIFQWSPGASVDTWHQIGNF